MGRKSPRSHVVHKHERKGKSVNDFNRGKGDHRKASISEIKLLSKRGTVDEQGRELKKIGERINYKDENKRVSGTVVGIRSEYYLVERKGKIWKVDRHSPFSRIGEALSGAGAKLLLAGKAGVVAVASKIKKLPGEIGGEIKEELERRLDERRNWNEWKKEMEKEEKLIFEREKVKIKREEKLIKFRKQIREGPKWKKALRVSSILTKEKTNQAQKKALISVVGKKRANNIIATVNRARKEEARTRPKGKVGLAAIRIEKKIMKVDKNKRKKKFEDIIKFDKTTLEFSKEEKQKLRRVVFPEEKKKIEPKELTEKEKEELK